MSAANTQTTSAMMRETVTIPAPLAREGDRVRVLNYRRVEGQWEAGKLAGEPIWYASKRQPFDGRWTYRVCLNRKSAAGRRIHLTVGDQQLERALDIPDGRK